MFAWVWRGLQAGKKVSKDELVGGTDYKYWRYQLKDLTDTELKKGFESTVGFDGFLGWSEFRNLCKEATRIEPSFRISNEKRLKTGKAPDAIRAKLREMVEQSKSWSQTHTRVKS